MSPFFIASIHHDWVHCVAFVCLMLPACGYDSEYTRIQSLCPLIVLAFGASKAILGYFQLPLPLEDTPPSRPITTDLNLCKGAVLALDFHPTKRWVWSSVPVHIIVNLHTRVIPTMCVFIGTFCCVEVWTEHHFLLTWTNRTKTPWSKNLKTTQSKVVAKIIMYILHVKVQTRLV